MESVNFFDSIGQDSDDQGQASLPSDPERIGFINALHEDTATKLKQLYSELVERDKKFKIAQGLGVGGSMVGTGVGIAITVLSGGLLLPAALATSAFLGSVGLGASGAVYRYKSANKAVEHEEAIQTTCATIMSILIDTYINLLKEEEFDAFQSSLRHVNPKLLGAKELPRQSNIKNVATSIATLGISDAIKLKNDWEKCDLAQNLKELILILEDFNHKLNASLEGRLNGTNDSDEEDENDQ